MKTVDYLESNKSNMNSFALGNCILWKLEDLGDSRLICVFDILKALNT